MKESLEAILNESVQKTSAWLKELIKEMNWQTEQQAYHGLRAVLHALRDRLTIEEVSDLGSQLPLIIRGIYYEGWNPSGKPIKARTHEDFMALISPHYRGNQDVNIDRLIRSVFRIISRHVTGGEVAHVKHSMPTDLQDYWPRDEELSSREVMG